MRAPDARGGDSWPDDLRQLAMVALRRVGGPMTEADLRAGMPAAAARRLQESDLLVTELRNLIDRGWVVMGESNGVTTYQAVPPKRLTGLMVKGPGSRFPDCRRFEACLAAAAQADGQWHCPAGDCFVPPQPLEAFALATIRRGTSSLAEVEEVGEDPDVPSQNTAERVYPKVFAAFAAGATTSRDIAGRLLITTDNALNWLKRMEREGLVRRVGACRPVPNSSARAIVWALSKAA